MVKKTSIGDEWSDRLVTNAIVVERYGGTISREALGILYQLEEELERRLRLSGLSSARAPLRRRRAEELLKRVQAVISKHYGMASKVLDKGLVDLSKLQTKAVIEMGEDIFKAKVIRNSLTAAASKSLVKDAMFMGNPATEWWATQANGLRHRFATQVRIGVANGEGIEDIVKRIRGGPTGRRRVLIIDGRRRLLPEMSSGVMDLSAAQARALVRTAVHTISQHALYESFFLNEDTIEGIQALATLDERTTEICIARDHAMWFLKTGKPMPGSRYKGDFPGPTPWHWQCRTILVPKMRTWASMVDDPELAREVKRALDDMPEAKRASVDGPVKDLPYEEWLKTKPEAFQIDVLGPARWKLWKDGKIGLHQLIDFEGNVLTLGELRARITGDAAAAVARTLERSAQRLDRAELAAAQAVSPTAKKRAATRLTTVLKDHLGLLEKEMADALEIGATAAHLESLRKTINAVRKKLGMSAMRKSEISRTA